MPISGTFVVHRLGLAMIIGIPNVSVYDYLQWRYERQHKM